MRRYWDKINIKGEDDCWEWQASLNDGYGQIRFEGKVKLSHQVSWISSNGPIPKGKCVLHKCDNRKCCNPKHLYIGTRSDNNTDTLERNPRTPEQISHPKLYEGEIWLIRRLRILAPSGRQRVYKFSASYVAKMFKVVESTIHKIWNSDKWMCKEGHYVIFDKEV